MTIKPVAAPAFAPARRRTFLGLDLAAVAAAAALFASAGRLSADPLPGFDLKPELTGQAVFSCQAFSGSGNFEIDSRGVVGGTAHGTEGHVRSNAGITLSGNVKVYGDALAGPGSQVVRSGNVTVFGTTGNAPALNCTPINLATLETQLLASNNNSQIPRTDKNKLALGGATGRTFTLSGNDGVTIPAGNYYFDSLSLSGNSTIRLDGRVNILVKGAISISGGGIVRQVGNVFQLRLFSRGSVAISGGAKFQGIFYAPEGQIALSGGAEVEGGFFAKNVTISGSAKVRRTVDDGQPTLALTAPAEGQSVAGCSVHVEGTAGDNEENGLAVTVNGQPAAVTNGHFALDLALGGADPSLIVAVATDAGGASTQDSRRIALVPPALGLTSPVPGSLVGQRLLALSGAAGHAATVTVDGVAAIVAGGNWSIPSFDLGADGAKTLSLVATWCGGTVSQSYPLELDTAAPVVAIDGPHSGDLFGSTPIVVTGTIAEAHLASLRVAGIAATVDGGRFTVSVPLAEGLNILAATAVDTLGRTTVSGSITVELDSIAPAVTVDSPATGVVVGSSPIVVSGHSEDPNLESVTIGGVTASLSGASFSLAVPLAEGENSLVAVARDRAGNSTSSPAVVAVLDTMPPTVGITAGELPTLTKEATVTVIGSAHDPHLDAVSVNGVAATLAGDSFSAVVPLTEGANSLVATASDVLAPGLPGHQASSPPASVVRDSTPPVLTLSEPAAGTLLASGTVTVRGTVADPHLLRVTVGGQEVTVTAGAFETVLELGDGPQTLAVRAVDSLDQATEIAVAVVVDTLPPVLSVTSPLDGALVTSGSVTVTGTASDPQLDTVTVNGEPASVAEDGAFSITVALEGATVTVIATDLAGHQSEKVLSLLRESQPPTLAFDPLPNAACSPGGLLATVGGSWQDDQAAAPAITLEVRPPAGAATTYPVTTAAGRFSASNVDLGGAEGLVTLVATATDAGGGSGQAIATVRVDALPPQLQITEGGAPFPGAAAGAAPPAGAAPLVLPRQVAFAAIVVDGAGGAPPAAVLTLDGAAYPAGAPITAGGEHLLVARATDCAGRSAVAHVFFRLDRSPPRLFSTDPAEGAQLEAGPASYRGTSDDDLAAATVGGRPATVTNGAFSLTPFPWQEGRNTLTIELVDAAGLRATYERTFTVSAAPLTVAIVENGLPIAPDQLFTRPLRPQAIASTSAAAVTLALDGAPLAAGSAISQPGAHTLVATATLGGRTVTDTATFRLDLSAGPTLTITTPEDASEVAGNTVEVAGTFTGDGVAISVDGRPATLSGNNFHLAGYPLAENEAVTITARATDRLGRQAEARVTVLHRAAGPRVLILDPADGTVTSRDRIDVAGAVVDPPSALQSPSVTIGGGAGGAMVVPLQADGSFRARDVLLGAGATVLEATAVDRFGQPGHAAVTVIRDGEPPAIAITANGQPLAEGAVFGAAVTVVVTFSDDSGVLTEKSVRLNGQLQPAGAGDSVSLPLADEGGYLISVAARDDAGNEARAELSFVIDRGGCDLSEIFPAAGAAVDSATVTLVGKSGEAAGLKVRVPGGAGVQEFPAQLADGTFLLAGVPLPQVGDNALELVCTDAAGRVQSTPHPLRRLAAGQGPAIKILSPLAGAVLGSERVAVSGSFSGGEATVNGVAATLDTGSNPKTFALAQLALAEGPNVIAARAVDAGRTAADRVVVSRDTQAPRLTITSPDSGTVLGIAGSAAARVDVSGRVELDDEPHLATVVVSTAAGAVTATVDPATGVFVALAVPLAENLAASQAQTLTAVATDSLGHSGQAQAQVYLDAGGPAILLTAPADLGRYNESSPAQIAVAAEVWAAAGATVTVNGATVPAGAIAWEAAGEDGRRHGTFIAQVALPTRDGAFGVIARVVAADQQRYAQARRLLIKDSVAPTVVDLLPAAGSLAVDPNTTPLVLFSEPIDHASLAAANGLSLVRVANGEAQAVSFAFAGNAVAVVPAAALAAGESYEVRAGVGIRDLSGHPLAAAKSAGFQVASSVLAAAPVIDPPLPAVLCTTSLTVQGQATAGAAVKVKDGSLLFTGNADITGHFSVRLPLAANGWHYLAVYLLDEATGIPGPAAGHAFRVDCSAPTVRDASFDRASGVISIYFSEAMDAASLTLGSAGDAVGLRDAEDPASPYHPGTLTLSAPTVARIRLDGAPEVWWRDRPVRLEVGSPARDERGNAMTTSFGQVFFPGSGGGLAGGFLFGEAWDDREGRPLAGARARLYSGAAGSGAPLAEVQTDGRGRYTFAGEVPAGRYAVLVEKSGYTPVVRRLALEPAKGAVPFDARLTPRAAALAEPLEPAVGGRRGSGLALEAAAAALPGSAPLTVSLTALSGQGLPDFLPLGYSPAAAAELRLEAAGVVLAEGQGFVAGNVVVELPLPAWVAAGDRLVAAQYELATGRWLALADPSRATVGTTAVARVAPLGPGTVAVLLADREAATAPPPVAAYAALEGSEPPAETPAFVAALTLDPPVVAPTGRSLARVVARSADGVTGWPSGLAVQAFLEEKLILAAGQGQLLEAPFVADLLLYHAGVSTAERAGNTEGSAGALGFVVSPSPRAAQVLLDVGFENIRLYPFPEETQRGQVVGPTGGTVGDPAAVELTVPEGALSSATVAEVSLLSAQELAALPAVAGFRTLAAVALELEGKELARPATLRLLRPAATANEIEGDPRLVLAELIRLPEDGRGAFARLVARIARQGSGPGQRLVAAPEAAGSPLPLDGIVREGTYLLLEAENSIGFATGLVRGAGSTLLQGARVTASPLGSADLSGLTGRYAVPVGVGAARQLVALHPSSDEKATAEVTVVAGQVVVADLTVQAVPPTILSFQPADGAQNQPTGTTVAMVFSEAIDPASVGSGTLELELATVDASGADQGLGVFAAGRVVVSGSQVRFEATRPLPPGRRFIARFKGGVRDLDGTFYAGAVPVEWRFTTSTVVAPGGQVDPAKFHARIPENGVVHLWGDPGAVPLAQVGQPPWSISPYLVGPFAGRDPVRRSADASGDGSFAIDVGRAGYAATLDSRVWVAVLDPTGQVAAEFELGPLTSADGKAFVARPGEAATFRSSEGLEVDVPAAAFEAATLVRLSLRPAGAVAVETPRGLAVGGVVALDFEGEAKETLRLHLPAPAVAAADAQVFIGEARQMPWGPALRFLSYGGVLERGGERFLSNDPSLQAEPDQDSLAARSEVLARADGDGESGAPRTCAEVKQRGLGRCFAQNLLQEFTHRSQAVFYYEAGIDWALLAGGHYFPAALGTFTEALTNWIADAWTFLPRPSDSPGNFWILPVVAGAPLNIEVRDVATGWVLQHQPYDPVPAGTSGVTLYAPIQAGPKRPPELVGAEPFDILRFAAPADETRLRLRLDVEVAAQYGQIEVKSVTGLPLHPHSTVALFGLPAPARPLTPPAQLPPDVPQPEPEPIPAPIEGPRHCVCGEPSWSLGAFSGRDELLLVVTPGDVDPGIRRSFHFDFASPLEAVEERSADEVALLRDLGPIDGCATGSVAGFPRNLPLEAELERNGQRLTLTLQSPLPGGHRFELELMPSGLHAEGAAGDERYAYPDTAPRRFAFATRVASGEPVGDSGQPFPFGGVSTARDLLRFGNLLLVGSDSGAIVAIDTSAPTVDNGLELHSIFNGSPAGVRTFATDGHNRLFYSEMFGPYWAIKGLRAEDARSATATCAGQPAWAAGVPCFDGVAGSVRIANLPGSSPLSASQYVATGAMPSGTPSDLEILAQDEQGKALDLEAFITTYLSASAFAAAVPDDEGIYTFALPLASTWKRFAANAVEPSQPGKATPNPATREKTCSVEEAYDRYQRVTVDNLTTGQTWSLDIENPWPADPAATGNGTATLAGLRARRGDRLQVRYNLRALGYVSITGSGISVVDLNRFYRLPQPGLTAGNTQCGRRLGVYEGAEIQFPACAVTGSGPEGLRYTPALEVHSETGCGATSASGAASTCRGTGRVDVYSPLLRVGGVHTKAAIEDPGYLQLGDLAACISNVSGEFAQPVDVALANDVTWIDYGIRGSASGAFQNPAAGFKVVEKRGDLLFLALGNAGVFAFDVSDRVLDFAHLIGHFKVDQRSSLRLQYAADRGQLVIGGSDFSAAAGARPVLDLWPVRYVNAAPGTRYRPASTATLFVPWSTRHLAFDNAGTGLLYTWDPERGPLAVPVDRPRFVFSGLYLAADAVPAAGAGAPRPVPVEKITASLLPLGSPMEAQAAAEVANRFENDKKATAAFKLRIALPGVFGESLTAKVQSLRALPEDSLLGLENLGAAVAAPGGPGWPDAETVLTLRRVGVSGSENNAAPGVVEGEGGQLGAAYNLYESVEKVLLVSDPRARKTYRRQKAEGDVEQLADEESQCRRCTWPAYLPDPEATPSGDPELLEVKEMLAGGEWVRAFLWADPNGDPLVRQATADAIAFFTAHAASYPLPAGVVSVVAPAAPVPSPFQSALAEPAQNPAVWSPGEAGISVALTGGDLLLGGADHVTDGRAMPFSFTRNYRSQSLGYGPLGSAGWHSELFARLRENAITGEVEYYDGSGSVWRFFPPEASPGGDYEHDPAGSYQAAKGVYLRLQKQPDGGWRLLGRHHDSAEFDAAGRLLRMSDRHRRGQDKEAQGSTIELSYDAFGQLAMVTDDLGRRYRFEYFEDPRPESQGGDGPRFGLLKKLVDFAKREVEYEFDAERRLTKVKMPEVKNPVDVYQADYSFEGAHRPTLEYRYGKAPLTDDTNGATRAVLHGDFAKLRLSEIVLPDFQGDSTPAPRAIFSYLRETGRLEKVSFPRADDTNAAGAGVVWQLAETGSNLPAGPSARIEVIAPWGHRVRYELEQGRTKKVEQILAVVQPATGVTVDETVATAFTYAGDGRAATVTTPDGGQITHCYPDAKNEAGNLCPVTPGPAATPDNLPTEPNAAPIVDRLSLANVTKVIHQALTPAGQGAADYDRLESSAQYEGDNLVASITDGLARGIQMPVPQANAESRVAFQAEGIGGKFENDAFGRVKKAQAGTANPYEMSVQFKADAKGKQDAGLPERVEQGTGQLWHAFDYDAQDNLKRFKSSQGAEALADYDLWDRLVRTKEGLADGRLAPVGNAQCGIAAEGAITERAFDAAGHLARERRLQDYIDANGSLQCRWVETRYTYNAREQLVEVAQTHLADPLQPGRVDPAAKTVMRLEYDEFGRLWRHSKVNQVDPNLVSEVRYDDAGRVVGAKVGDAAEQVRGYDRQSRVVRSTDGDQAVWLGRYDVWDRLYLSQSPTGAFTRNLFDKAGHLTETSTFDRDPLGSEASQAKLLALTRSHFTSFSEPDKVVQILVDESTGSRQILVTRREFDDAGRVKALWSGPAQANAEEIDPDQRRRESETVYEPGTGRVLEQWRGGYFGQAPLVKQKFGYLTDNASNWPDRMSFFEAVPGQPELVETASASYRRDALGRVIEEKRNDGALLATAYDRSSNLVLQVRTGADSLTRASYDGAGRQIRVIRPNDRGETLYQRDLDGRLHQQVVKTASGDWVTSYRYDATGRPTRTDYQDGSFSATTYNPDNTIATQRSRDGVMVTFGYDAANRPLSQVPSQDGAAAAHQVPLDAGNFAGFDQLSRPTALSRGSAGGAGIDAGLSVAYPSYDLGSRPGSETVGARGPLSWQYDVYSRPERVFLPAGAGRDPAGAFQGFRRQFDTLDRVTDVSGIGNLSATTLGATWSWGGGRLYGMNTKGTLGTSLRLGYLGGEGPQTPGGVADESKWKLGTLTWGAGASAATALPEQVWGQFGFGYRGTEGDPRDGAKIGREAMKGGGLDLFGGLGWSWDYDAGVRLAGAWPGRGDRSGRHAPETDGFRYEYGKGDELERVIDEAAGKVADTQTGAYGRIVSRGGVAFNYDPAGRRTEDDRFVYDWNWRSELMQVTVKETWPNGEETPYAGNQVRYAYDAMGRLQSRSHYGTLPAGVTDESQRPLIEKRVFVWEGQSLLAEAGYGDANETQLRWRKTYVPGPGGLDDAVQVIVDNVAFPAQGKKLYTYLRDELGTVMAVAAEEESQDKAKPTIPVRYHYTPYGEAHAEIGPELRRVRFDGDQLEVGGVQQDPETPLTAGGAIRLTFSIPIDPATIAAGLTLEEQTAGSWQPVSGAQLLTGIEDQEGLELPISVRSAWKRGTKYRISVGAGLKDLTGRPLVAAQIVEFTISAMAQIGGDLDRRFPEDHESWQSAGETLGGRFPGGQTKLFQGLWTDPVTGISYARARWYDSRNASWLREDPQVDVDSPNYYSFVGWKPQFLVDPLGLAGQAKEPGPGRQVEIIEKAYQMREARAKIQAETDPWTVTVRWTFGMLSNSLALNELTDSATRTKDSFNKTEVQISANWARRPYKDEYTDDDVLPAQPGLEQTAAVGQTSRNVKELSENAAETTYRTIDTAGRVNLAKDVFGAVGVGIVRKLTTGGVEEQLDYLMTRIPGLDRNQARVLLDEAQKRGSSVVFGGSRVRGDFKPTSDLDVGFGNLTTSQAEKVLSKAERVGGLKIEKTKIVPGNETPYIRKIESPEEFFQRSGTRTAPDPRAGEQYFPSGSITVMPGGEIIEIPAGAWQ